MSDTRATPGKAAFEALLGPAQRVTQFHVPMYAFAVPQIEEVARLLTKDLNPAIQTILAAEPGSKARILSSTKGGGQLFVPVSLAEHPEMIALLSHTSFNDQLAAKLAALNSPSADVWKPKHPYPPLPEPAVVLPALKRTTGVEWTYAEGFYITASKLAQPYEAAKAVLRIIKQPTIPPLLQDDRAYISCLAIKESNLLRLQESDPGELAHLFTAPEAVQARPR